MNDYLRIIQKKSGLVVVACLVTFIFTFVLNQTIAPVYRAETRLLVEEKLQDVNLTRNMLMSSIKRSFLKRSDRF